MHICIPMVCVKYLYVHVHVKDLYVHVHAKSAANGQSEHGHRVGKV